MTILARNDDAPECTYWEDRHAELAGDLARQLHWLAHYDTRAFQRDLADWLNARKEKNDLEGY